ncbi:hypothetical protein CLV24_12758 [Pontibacter ummariensis]|nr:hypothetical protein CLV24_12758 [Pontibacter ummariensis]
MRQGVFAFIATREKTWPRHSCPWPSHSAGFNPAHSLIPKGSCGRAGTALLPCTGSPLSCHLIPCETKQNPRAAFPLSSKRQGSYLSSAGEAFPPPTTSFPFPSVPLPLKQQLIQLHHHEDQAACGEGDKQVFQRYRDQPEEAFHEGQVEHG